MSKHQTAMDCFATFNSRRAQVSDDKMTVTKSDNSGASATIYGNITIPYNTINIHEWKIKVIAMRFPSTFAIGIDEANCKSMSSQFYDSGQSYGYRACGSLHAESKSIGQGPTYKADDILTMIYDGKDKTITFKKNDDKIPQIIKVKNSEHGYKMVVYFTDKGDGFRLLSYKKQQNTEHKQDETMVCLYSHKIAILRINLH